MTGQHRDGSRLLIPRQISSFVFTPKDRPDAVVQCSPPGSGYSPTSTTLHRLCAVKNSIINLMLNLRTPDLRARVREKVIAPTSNSTNQQRLAASRCQR